MQQNMQNGWVKDMMQYQAKPIVQDKFWIVEKNGEKVGTVHAVPNLEHVPFPFDSGLFTEYYAARKA